MTDYDSDEAQMPRQQSISGQPELHGSQTSLRRRKTSFNEHSKRNNHYRNNDLLQDPISLSQVVNLGNVVESPIDNVRTLVENHPDDTQPVFTELMLSNGQEWRQAGRFLRYEQLVEGDFTRFSKPHITLLHLQSVLQLKNCFKRGVVLLDLETKGFQGIVDAVIEAWCDRGMDSSLSKIAKRVLMAKKYHLGSDPSGSKRNTDHIHLVKTENGTTVIESAQEKKTIDEEGEDHPESINKANRRLYERLSKDTVSAVVLAGICKSLDQPVAAFVRIQEEQSLYPIVPDLPVPTKFLFFLLSPTENYENEQLMIARTMGVLMTDEIFKKVAFHCTETYTLGDALDEFMSQIVAVPPGKCSVSTRWEPKETDTGEHRNVGMLYARAGDHTPTDSEEQLGHAHSTGIVRTGRLFGGLIQDIKNKAPFYLSEYTDFFGGRFSQSLAATIFLFFANITSIITFGAVMERTLHHQMAAMEAILCGGISGVIFAMFSGQPLNILSATGPTLVFEKILFDFCLANGWEFLPFRCYVGIWIVFFLILLVVTDMSALVGLITRFTEEAFATLISIVFIIQAFQKLQEISHDAPIIADPREVYQSPCFCILDEFDSKLNYTVKNRIKDVTADDCLLRGGISEGLQCHFKPDVYMLSVLLTFGTFGIAYALNKFRHSQFFTSKLRNAVSDFGVVIAIIAMTGLSHFIGLDVPSLHVPANFKPTLDRSWLLDLSGIPTTVILVASIPAAFYMILIVMDQQITAVIINRKDNLLKKGSGYHLDLLVIAVLVLICSFLGLPFYVAATVLSVMHINSLKLQSESSAPGEVAQFLGVKEQRLTGIIAHLLIGLSVFLTGIIKLVPLPVLIGIFLYMGVVSLLGQQFVQRIALLFMSTKHQPDYSWLRHVRMKRVHIFTTMQILSIVALFLVKYTKSISMMFPLMLVFMVLIRMFILERIFTREELTALDDLPPTFGQVMKPSISTPSLSKDQEETLLKKSQLQV